MNAFYYVTHMLLIFNALILKPEAALLVRELEHIEAEAADN